MSVVLYVKKTVYRYGKTLFKEGSLVILSPDVSANYYYVWGQPYGGYLSCEEISEKLEFIGIL